MATLTTTASARRRTKAFIEPLEARRLLNAAVVAQASSAPEVGSSGFAPPVVQAAAASGTLSVALTLASTTVHQSQAFTARMTITNTGSETVSSVTPQLTQATGSVLNARFYSPTVASIAPGKSAVFTFSLLELATGVQTLSADAGGPFGSSSGAASVTVLVLPKTIGTSAITDSSGDAYLKVGPRTVPIQIVDHSTGLPISGLSLAVSGANRQNSRAVVVVADSLGRYPLQMVVLQGSAVAAKPGAGKGLVRATSGLAPLSSTPTAVNISSGAGTALSAAVGAIQTDFLPSPTAGDSPTGISGAFTAALRALTMSKLPLPLPFAGSGAPRKIYSSGPIHLSDTMTRIAQVVGEFAATGTVGEVIMGGLELAAAGEISLPLAAVMLTSDFTFAESSNALFEETDASDVTISVESSGGIPFIIVTPVTPPGGEFTFTPKGAVADVTINGKSAGGQALSGGSYELISKDDLGLAITGVLDSNGSANIPVELGNYDLEVSSPASQPFINSSLNVTGSGVTVNPSLAAQPIVSGTLTSAVGQPTGFLAPGTQYSLTAHFFDSSGNEVQPVGPVIFQVHNPVGATVATVDPNTGLVTMGPGFGAALITAWCNGVTTTAKLVSTNGNGKYPIQSNVPFAVSPTALHFAAMQGSNPAAQSFNVVGLSDNFTGYHYTSHNGWLTVAPANVSGFNVFNVSVNTTGYNPGTYSLPITISDDNSSFHQTIIATLTIAAAPTPTLAGTYSGNWTYPVFGFGDDHANLTWFIHQSGHTITGTYRSVILAGSVDSTGEVNTDSFTGTIEGNAIVLNNTGGSSFFATIVGNTITGTSNYLQATSSYTLTAQ